MDSDEIFQDLCNVWGIHGTLQYPVDIRTFLAGAEAVREMGKEPATEARHMMQCIQKMHEGLGSIYFRQLFDTPADVDDFWQHYWCPQPPGTDLASADCPAGTHPLWTNGSTTVFVRPYKDEHGNDVFDFGIYPT